MHTENDVILSRPRNFYGRRAPIKMLAARPEKSPVAGKCASDAFLGFVGSMVEKSFCLGTLSRELRRAQNRHESPCALGLSRFGLRNRMACVGDILGGFEEVALSLALAGHVLRATLCVACFDGRSGI